MKWRVAGADELGVARLLATMVVACAAALMANPALAGDPQTLVGARQPGPAQAQVVALANEARAAGARCGAKWYPAAGPLSWDARLGAAALRHIRDMARRDYFDHTSPRGTTAFDRIRAAGYRYGRAGENIAAGRSLGSPAAVVAALLASPAHCRVLMNPAYTDVGVGRAEGPGAYSTYWTQALGSPRR